METIIETKLKTDECGFKYYDSLPINFVLAQAEDFFTKVAVYDDDNEFVTNRIYPKVGHAFLIHSFHYPVYWAYRLKKDFDITKLDPWFKENRVFIWKNDL